MERRTDEPAGAITLARTLLEDVCKWILEEAGETWREADDLPTLYRKLAKVLKLAPDDHTEQVFKQILGSCQSVVESVGRVAQQAERCTQPWPETGATAGSACGIGGQPLWCDGDVFGLDLGSPAERGGR